MSAPSAKQAKDLMNKKDEIEAEIKELLDVLESQKGVGMTGALIDNQQFPRTDIDIPTVRHARHRVICLQNDHKAIMKEIEDCLHALHAAARAEKETNSTVPMETESSSSSSQSCDRVWFATVDRVDVGSPAEQAGLLIGDKIIQFGSIDANNFQNLQSIGTVVQHSKGKPINVFVQRQHESIHLVLTPNTWNGKGLLGCNIIPKQS